MNKRFGFKRFESSLVALVFAQTDVIRKGVKRFLSQERLKNGFFFFITPGE